MKIAFVVHDYHRSGGHSRYVAELAERFCAAHEVHVFANTCTILHNPRIQFHRVPAWRANALTLIATFRWNATRLLRHGGYHIIHDQGLCCARQYVITAHICNAAWAASRPTARWTERLFALVVEQMERWQYWRAGRAQVIAVSERVRYDLARYYRFPNTSAVIYHGVDAAAFSPALRAEFRTSVRNEIGVPPDAPLFLFVGDLRKGADACIRALETGWLLCVGSTPPAEYRKLAATLGRENRVIFHPATDHIERLYAAADAFLLPTPYDAFGMVVLEALAAGLPVIVSRQAGAAELIEHGVNGWILNTGADLPHLMATALTRPDVAAAGRATALGHSWDRVASETMRVYESAARQPRVLAFATQGAGGNDEARLRTLLSEINADFFPFDRTRKANSALALFRRMLRGHYDLAIMEGTGIAGGIPLLLARCAGLHYIFSSGDAIAPFVAAQRPALGWLFGIYERLLCRAASAFIGWSPYLSGRALTYGVPRAATAAGWSLAPTGRRDRTRQELGIPPHAIVIGIVGSLEWNAHRKYCYGLELVRALNLLQRENIYALIVGAGTGLSELRQLANQRVIFTGAVPREQVPGYLAAMDLASLPQSCDGLGSFRYTTKLSEYIAAGLPIVTGQIPLAYDLDDGWIYRLPGHAPWDPRYLNALAAVLERIGPEELAAKRQAVPVNPPLFDRDRQIARVTALVRDVLESL